MWRQLLNWRSLLALVAILIVSGTIWYSSYLADKIEREERQKVGEWISASKALLNPDNQETDLSFRIIQDNTDIPIIETDEKDSVTNFQNLDSTRTANPAYLHQELRALKKENAPVIWTDPRNKSRFN